MPHVPYVGITDFLSYAQVERMSVVFSTCLAPKQQRRLHVGVMMSRKTLNDIDTSWAKAFPKKEEIADIFALLQTMNCLHYADYDALDVAENLKRAISCGGSGMNALQLDMLWPNPDAIARAVATAARSIEVIVQVGKQAIERSENNPAEIVRQLQKYVGVAHHVLIDKSMGKGKGMDAQALLPFARAIRNAFPEFGLVAAGGLGPASLDLVMPLVDEFPDISIDAQGQMRSSGDSHDPIEWHLPARYLGIALTRLP